MNKPGRWRHIALIGFIVATLLMAVVVTIVAVKSYETHERQLALEPFYELPSPLPEGAPGTVFRSESFDSGLAGVAAWRILYLTERSDGSVAASSGMIFAPSSPAPAGGWPVVAWAHGTVGLGDECAPSRTKNPVSGMSWLSIMIANGWVVVATDYAGLGTAGTSEYLVGKAEAHDVLNSVRATVGFQGASASPRFATWGHSQGGHASLWAAQLAPEYAPELELVAATAAAPAAELVPLIDLQYENVIAWVIGADISVSWPPVYPQLELTPVVTSAGINNYRRLADECIAESALEAELRNDAGEKFFSTDPSAVASWRATATSETVSPLPASLPVFVAQGLADEVVIPSTTASLAMNFCAAGSNLTMDWLGDTNHTKSADVSGPTVATWLQQRFAGVPAQSTCSTTVPVTPAAS